MSRSSWLLASLAVALWAGAAPASPRLGAALLGSDTTACAAFRGDPLRVGDHVFLFGIDPPSVTDGWIAGPASKPCNTALDAPAYLVRLRRPLDDEPGPGIALFDPSARVEYVDGEFVVRTEGAAAPLQFRQCASNEGLHLTAWRGNRRTWHEYWYLGFDVEPNCSEKESAP